MRPKLLELENIFMPGLSTITWTSMKIPEFCQTVDNVLEKVQLFIKGVTDMKEARIDEVLESISNTVLIYLPDVPLFPTEFFDRSLEYNNKICKC